MRRQAHAKTRDENEPEIVKALRELGCRVWTMDQPADLLLQYPDGTWDVWEVKNSTGANVYVTKDEVRTFADMIQPPALCFSAPQAVRMVLAQGMRK